MSIHSLVRVAAIICTLMVAPTVHDATASNYKTNVERFPAMNRVPPRVATWKVTPTVLICEHSPVTKEEATKAVKFWKNLGYRFFRTQYKYDPLNKCLSNAPVGYIVVRLMTQGINLEDTALAETHFFVNNDTHNIDWAIIYTRAEVRETVLEHEIGHALGFLHYNKINHLMNEKWLMGGWDTEGLKK